MAATATLNTKLDPSEKEEFVEIAESLGMTASSALKVFVRRFIDCKGFPFDVRAYPSVNWHHQDILETTTSDNGTLIVPAEWRDDDEGDD